MEKQNKLDRAYMKCAYAMAELSHAIRLKVGAVIVSPTCGIIAEGLNGMPAGFSNCCEEDKIICLHDWRPEQMVPDLEYCSKCDEKWCKQRTTMGEKRPGGSRELVTRKECVHAEENAIAKIAISTNSSVGATLYITHSPCFECCKLIKTCKIVRVVYAEKYRDLSGLDFLCEADIKVDEHEMV